MSEIKHSPALTALLDYRQADMDGIMVLSRQDIHEIVGDIDRLRSINTELLEALEPFAFIAKIAGKKPDDLKSEMVALKHCRRARTAIAKARGESEADPDWFRSVRDQCSAHGVAFLFKQWSGSSQKAIKAMGRELDGVVHDGYPQGETGHD